MASTDALREGGPDATPPDAAIAKPGASPDRGSTWRWAALAVLLALIASSMSTYAAARVVAQNVRELRRSFSSSAEQVGSTLKLATQHEEDLVVGAAAMLATNESATSVDLLGWAQSVRAFQRYPELEALGSVAVVPASQVADYARRASRRGQPLNTVPAGSPEYCFATTSVDKSSALSGKPALLAPGQNLCPGPLGAAVLAVRDAGVASYAPYGPSVLVIQTPFYRGGGVPTDLSVRRRQFLGVSATVINPETLLDAALQGHPGIGVTLHFHGSGSDVAFSSHVPKGSQPDRVEDLGNGWTAETVGPSTARSTMFRVPSARNLLLTGCAVSILLGLLVFVLGTGRARALRLVAEKTEHIRLQSLHDGLTGLPNRVLILDRVEQALTRARRGGTPVAVMFLDLDGFKGINDTYGHAVGDQLLQAVSTRLLGAIRGSDTVGRLGGDEFILVVEGDSLVDGASPIADRILAALAIPFELRTPEPLVVRTHASVGIATGLRDDASQLLRDADAAMYQAKATGKNRQVTYAASMRADV